jgi:hypothetical protein
MIFCHESQCVCMLILDKLKVLRGAEALAKNPTALNISPVR